MSCPCCACRICYASFSSITAAAATGVIAVDKGQISINISGGPIVPRTATATQYLRGFSGSAYDWPCLTLPGSNSVVALKEESEGAAYEIALSAPGSRIVMPIISLGAFLRLGPELPPLVNKSVTWQFSEELSIYSQGAHTFFGQCEQPGQCLQGAGATLTGLEGSGIIQFTGEISALTLSVVGPSENYNAFGIGLPCETNPLP